MPHINTLPGQHDQTVTAYIIWFDGTQPKVLLHMHRKLKILLPVGGHVELDETPWQSLSHEIEEESGFTLDQLEVLQPKERISKLDHVKLHPYPVVINTHSLSQDHFHSDIAYAFTTKQLPRKPVAKGESNDLRWYTAAELKDLSDKDIFSNTRQTYSFILDICLKSWQPVAATSFDL